MRTGHRSHVRKSLPIKVKATDEEQGIVEAIVATYDVDSYGEQIVPGAFAKSIEARKADPQADGGLMPWVWSHQSNDPKAFLGSVIEMEERADEGLYVKALHDMEDPDSAKAFRLLKSGRVRQYSFAYDAEWREKDGAPGIIELTEIEIFEAGPTLVGVNRNTHTIDAKASKAEGDDDGKGDEKDDDRSFDLSFDGDWTDAEKEAALAAVDAIRSGKGEGEGDTPDEDDDGAKARALSIKAGRVLSSKNESAIREAVEKLNGVLDSLAEDDDSDPAKAHRSVETKGNGIATPEDPTVTAGPSLDELALEVELALFER